MKQLVCRIERDLDAYQLTGSRDPVVAVSTQAGTHLFFLSEKQLRSLLEKIENGDTGEYYFTQPCPMNVGPASAKSPCPSCGCELYKDAGPCEGTEAVQELARISREWDGRK